MSANASSSAGTGLSASTDAALGTLTTGENMHPLSNFFGPVHGTHEQLRADDRLSHETYNLPRAYVGKNKYLEEVLDFMIRKEDEFYTSRLLPWEFTDDLHISWEIFSFNRTLADLVPHQGLPRFVTQESESHSDNLLRRGLAFIIEHSRVNGMYSGTMTDQCRKASSGVVTSLSNSWSHRRQALVA